MPTMTVLHFASPFAFSMPAQKSRPETADGATAVAGSPGTGQAPEATGTLSADAVPPATATGDASMAAAETGSGTYAAVLRHYTEQTVQAEDANRSTDASPRIVAATDRLT